MRQATATTQPVFRAPLAKLEAAAVPEVDRAPPIWWPLAALLLAALAVVVAPAGAL